jgi:hypothetical protein
MSTLAATTATRVARPHRTFARRFRAQRPATDFRAPYVPADSYIPTSTADMWRSSKRRFAV